MKRTRKPNVIFVFGDQWRARATGFNGNAQARTPNLDRFAEESVNLVNAIAGCPVCSPYRASLMTGQFPLTHGVFLNDVTLGTDAVSLAEAFKKYGYAAAYVGKWHLDGHGRSNYIPPERRQGFDYWKVLECSHNYNESAYYAGNDDRKRFWEGYDAFAQTDDAIDYLRNRDHERPFLLVLSWGPPHAPYQTAPESFRKLFDQNEIVLPPNIPETAVGRARRDLAGYYAHGAALDHAFGKLLDAVNKENLEEDTIVVFTSDHGDMLGSHGEIKKQRPWDESIRVPFLLRFPAGLEREGRRLDAVVDAPDIMPTLLGLCAAPIPDTVEGIDFSNYLAGGPDPSDGAGLLQCPHPFGQWNKPQHGGREYRGLRTRRHTYVRDLDGPWLLHDNLVDPYQTINLIDDPEQEETVRSLNDWLSRKLAERNDQFLPGIEYVRKWGYVIDVRGTVSYEN